MEDERKNTGMRSPHLPVPEDADAQERVLIDAWHSAIDDADDTRPPPLLDARILRAARAAGHATPRATINAPEAWRWATAATLILAVAVVWLAPKVSEPDPFAAPAPADDHAAAAADATEATRDVPGRPQQAVEEVTVTATRMDEPRAPSNPDTTSARFSDSADSPAPAAPAALSAPGPAPLNSEQHSAAPPGGPAAEATRPRAWASEPARKATAAARTEQEAAAAGTMARARTEAERELGSVPTRGEWVHGTLERDAAGTWRLRTADAVIELGFPASGAPVWLAEGEQVEALLTEMDASREAGLVLEIARRPPAD